ncbi:MAG: death on curing protein [Patescibacteria group bacterium]|nr:death on curing protein [Patescibacteria group bacterium]
MQILIPDITTVEELHDIVIEVSGGKNGMHNRNLLISAIERPSTYIQYVDSYDLDTICSLLIEGVAQYHGFKDGNKRTALMTTIFTYRLNDVHFRATNEMNVDFDDFVIWIVNKKPDIHTITKRLKELRKKHQGDKESWRNIIAGFIKQAVLHTRESKDLT